MIATIAPAAARETAARNPDVTRRAQRAVQVAFRAVAGLTGLTLVALAATTAIVAARVLAFGLAHQHMPFFRGC